MKLVIDKTPLVSSLWARMGDKRSWNFPEGTHTWCHREFSSVIGEALGVIEDMLEFHIEELQNCPEFNLSFTPDGFGHSFRYYSGFNGRHTSNILADYLTVYFLDKSVPRFHIKFGLLLEKHQEVRKGELTSLIADIMMLISMCAFESFKRSGIEISLEEVVNKIFGD